MNPFKITRENGFTVLEVVFACSILAIGIMGYTILKSSSRHSRVYSKNLSQAIHLTSSELEGLLVEGYNSSLLTATPGTNHFYSVDVGGIPTIGDFQATDTEWSVRENCPTELTKLVDYSTQWGSKSMTLTQVQVRP